MRTLAVTLLLASATTLSSQAAPAKKAAPPSAPVATTQPLKNADLATRLKHVHELLATTPLVDGHNDLPWYIREHKTNPRDVPAYELTKKTDGMTDIPRLRQGQVGAQFWSVYVPGEVKDSGYARIQLEEIDIARQVIARYPKDLKLVTTAAELRAAHKSGRIGSLLGMEGGHAIENSLGALRAYYDLGARYMTLTHNVTLDWADAALDAPKHGGLTNFGREVVREMNRLGMLVDLSHVSPGVMSNALDVTEAPVIFSHSSSRALTNVARNVPDSILRRLPKNDGVVMVAFVTGFVSQKVADYGTRSSLVRDSLRRAIPDTAAQSRAMADWTRANPSPKATLSDVADHMDHIKQVAGASHVGLGSDFDGITDNVVGLEDVSKFPDILAELIKRGWTDAEVRGVAGENVLRVLTRAEAVSARLRRSRPASTATIEQMDGKRGM